MGHLQANVALAKRVLARAVPQVPEVPDWPEHRSLDGAIMTPEALWPDATRRRLVPILQRFRG
jgi:hypothetical protein